MKKIILLMLLSAVVAAVAAPKKTFLANEKSVDLYLDGKKIDGGWHVSPHINPDVLETMASTITFVSDSDSLTIDNLGEWESLDLDMLTDSGDTAHVRVDRVAVNKLENPDPRLLKRAESGMLTAEQAAFDIDALIYALSQVHPDMFSVCRQADLLRAVNRAKGSLPDSVAVMELFRAAAPIVAMIGDGHTNMSFPYSSTFTPDLKRMPLGVRVSADRSMRCLASLDSIIPADARIVSINGVAADSIIEAMMPYVSGERPHFKMSRIDAEFPGLFQMLYSDDSYTVAYEGEGTTSTVELPAVTTAEMRKRLSAISSRGRSKAYSLTTDSANNVAVMDFRSFVNAGRMEHFADSMFTELKNKNIGNLIIDLRNNGGGNSAVGDVLLRYISPEPFIQMDKAYVRIAPLTSKLMNEGVVEPTMSFFEVDPEQFIKPRSADEGHYDGKVYLLTSNKTFSSAGSFAWAFKECGMGTVVGEETGGMNVCYGDILTYTLPISKIKTTISFKRFWQLRADENDIHGTLPDVAVNADDALDTALRLAAKNRRKR